MAPEDKYIEVVVPGKFNSVQEVILDYLYTHPNENIGTSDLARDFESANLQKHPYEDVQFGVEILVAARLVR
ncbi:MAG: hypothetical protein WA876_01530 [Candidatus Acidiferrales bacterium]